MADKKAFYACINKGGSVLPGGDCGQGRVH